jgi:hypothetical protein
MSTGTAGGWRQVTLTCDTAPVTDPDADPRFATLRAIVDELDAARERVKDLERLRDEESVRVIGDQPGRGLIVATARAAKISRQQLDTIRRLARAKQHQ